jgi:hypothetical protein
MVWVRKKVGKHCGFLFGVQIIFLIYIFYESTFVIVHYLLKIKDDKFVVFFGS